MTPPLRRLPRSARRPFALLRNSLLQLIASVALAALLVDSAAHANGVDAESFLHTLEKQRGKVDTFAARFVQKKRLALFDEQKTSAGVVLYKAPRRMIWKYETPDKTQMRIDGRSVSFYFPELEQIEVYPSEESGGASPFFFAFEATADEIKKSFDVSVVCGGAERLSRVELSPKSEPLASELQSITLWLGESDYLPRRIRINEISGDVTEIELIEGRINGPIADEELKFDAPEGTEVIEAGPGGL
jgi:outer membrane lipoprotein-sorting protein